MSDFSSAESLTRWRATRSRMRSRISCVVRDADVGADERVLEFIEQVGVDFLLAPMTSSMRETKPARVFSNAALEFSIELAPGARSRRGFGSFFPIVSFDRAYLL